MNDTLKKLQQVRPVLPALVLLFALTTLEFISNLAQSLPVELGVETYVVHEGEIVEHYRPPQAKADNGQV
jgi:hypothetical protein